jgi:hypothetical protein
VEIFLTISHIIGTALGVGSATLAEIFFLKSARDGVIDPQEGSTLKTIYTVLRVGMVILVLSGFGFLVLYRLTGQAELIYQPKLWAKLTIILILLLGVIGWRARKVPALLDSAVSLTSWYAALVLGIWRSAEAGYATIMLSYVAAVVLVLIILHGVRKTLGIKL